MIFRRTKDKDRQQVVELWQKARTYFQEAGIDQWQDGYPNEASARQDLEASTSYVLEDGGKILATACLAFGHEPTYGHIEHGAWAGAAPYGFLHRIAVLPEAKGKGAAGLFFDELKRQAQEKGIKVLRGDTHRDNKPMQRVMEKNGLTYRGVIHIEDGAERLAYEALLG